jgi:hypothetical protein
MLDCSIRMSVCCSALTIFDVRLLKGGVTMRLRLVDLGASISALCCRSQIGLVLGSALKNCIDGNPKNIHIRFNSESHPPVERHGLPKGMVRLRSTGSFHQKECFGFFLVSTPAMPLVPCPVNSVGYPKCDRRSPCQCQAGGRCRSVGPHQPSASRSQRLVPVLWAFGLCISPRRSAERLISAACSVDSMTPATLNATSS